MQIWTVPTTGDYTITAAGAQGASADSLKVGGKGAQLTGTFTLTEGATLRILVGQLGLQNASSGGGGGGTFVVHYRALPATTFADVLLVAGGGGGTRTAVDQNGCDGRDTVTGGTGSGSSTTHTCVSW